jgi:hypothetical protein
MKYGSRCSKCLIFVHDNCKEKHELSLECHQQRSPLKYQKNIQNENIETKNNLSSMTGWMNALLSPRFETLGPSNFFGTNRINQRGRYRTSSSSDAPTRDKLLINNFNNNNNEKINEQGNGKCLKTFYKLMSNNNNNNNKGNNLKEKYKQQKSMDSSIIYSK